MNTFVLIAIKLAIGFLALTAIINVSGKGNLAPTSATDQVQNYVLGGIIGGVIYNRDISISEYLIILAIWCALVLTFRWIKKRNIRIRELLDGRAYVVIEHGKVIMDNLEKVGLSAHDIAFKLRTLNIYSIKKVKRAVIEQNGQLIAIQFGEENPKFPLITDGQIHHDILEIINKDEGWLLNELKEQGYESFSEIFLAEYIDGELILFPY